LYLVLFFPIQIHSKTSEDIKSSTYQNIKYPEYGVKIKIPQKWNESRSFEFSWWDETLMRSPASLNEVKNIARYELTDAENPLDVTMFLQISQAKRHIFFQRIEDTPNTTLKKYKNALHDELEEWFGEEEGAWTRAFSHTYSFSPAPLFYDTKNEILYFLGTTEWGFCFGGAKPTNYGIAQLVGFIQESTIDENSYETVNKFINIISEMEIDEKFATEKAWYDFIYSDGFIAFCGFTVFFIIIFIPVFTIIFVLLKVKRRKSSHVS